MPRRSLRALACLLLGLGTVLAAPAPAQAGSALLCTSYTRCAEAGMPNAGYAKAARSMYWRMYAGHNCTNYVAYRMIRSGMPDVRPWAGGGNATNWGTANRRLTDSVARVGAVAWWRAHANPAGAVGHVAYVERVLSPTEIVVSQDSWGGDFSWRRITRGSGLWPSGFVHFNDVRLRNTVRPTLTGTAKVGKVLTARPGRWSVAGARYRYQWLAGGRVVAGATRPTLTLTRAQVALRLSVRVTASRVGYPTTTASSARTATVSPALLSHTARPTIDGRPQVSSTLTADPGTWSPAPVTLAYQWSADGVPLRGETGTTFTPGAAQVGRRLTVTVTGSRSGYVAVADTSLATAVVAPGELAPGRAVAWTGAPRLGQRLTAVPGSTVPAGPARYRWLRSGRPVPGATGATYRLTKADLGSHIRVSSTASRPGYADLTTTSGPTSRVRSTPTLRVTTVTGGGRVTLTATVTAPGVSAVTGTVRVRTPGQRTRDLVLRRGRATVTYTGLAPGNRSLRLHYLTSRTVLQGTTTVGVRVR
jgi:surface antigen